MKDKMVQNDIINDIKESAPKFKAELPAQAWSRIESRLNESNSQRQISFYKLFYNAAIIFLVIGAITVISYFIMSQDEVVEPDNYAQNIQELRVSNNSYPVYDVHKLHRAYLRLESAGILAQPVN